MKSLRHVALALAVLNGLAAASSAYWLHSGPFSSVPRTAAEHVDKAIAEAKSLPPDLAFETLSRELQASKHVTIAAGKITDQIEGVTITLAVVNTLVLIIIWYGSGRSIASNSRTEIQQ